jgi:serine/threonine-protein kinase RsbW
MAMAPNDPAAVSAAVMPDRELLKLSIATTFECVSAAGDRLAAVLDPCFDADQAAHLRLGLVEALTNVVEHGYRGQPDGQMHLSVMTGPSHWCFRLVDAGLPIPASALAAADGSVFEFDPDALDALPEGGMGLSLIRMVFDQVDYQCAAGRNELTLTRYLVTG